MEQRAFVLLDTAVLIAAEIIMTPDISTLANFDIFFLELLVEQRFCFCICMIICNCQDARTSMEWKQTML